MYLLGTAPSILHILSYLIPVSTLWNMYYYDLHFVDSKTGRRELGSLLKAWEAVLEGFETRYPSHLPNSLAVTRRCPQPSHLHPLPLPIPPNPFQQPSGIGAETVHNKETHIKSKENFRGF